MSSENLKTVELRRSVRYGRLLIGGAIVGALAGSLLALLFPVPEGALYSVRQIAGFMLVIGGAVGLLLGAVLALILSAAAKRQHGSAVVAQVFDEEPVAEGESGSNSEDNAAGASVVTGDAAGNENAQ